MKMSKFDDLKTFVLSVGYEFGLVSGPKEKVEKELEIVTAEDAKKVIHELELKLEKAVEALEYYADRFNWDSEFNYVNDTIEDDGELIEYIVEGVDCSEHYAGRRARAVLKEIKGE